MAVKQAKGKKVTVASKKVAKKKLTIARLLLKAAYNNSIVTLADMNGKVLAWSSAGKSGFKGTRKSTPFAAQKATEDMIAKAKEMGVTTFHLQINGAGMGRDSFIRSVQASEVPIESIKDTTGFPHGGVRKKQESKG